MGKVKTPITDKNGKNTSVWKNDGASADNNVQRVGRLGATVVTTPKDSDMDDQLHNFLDAEFSNYRTAVRQGDAYVDDNGDELPFTWFDAMDSLNQMPDDILADIIESDDVEGFRTKFAAVVTENGEDTEIDF